MNRKDKEYLQLSQKKENLEEQLLKKEETAKQAKKESQEEKERLLDRIEEFRMKYNQLSDDFLNKKIQYEKSIALST